MGGRSCGVEKNVFPAKGVYSAAYITEKHGQYGIRERNCAAVLAGEVGDVLHQRGW
jgi:hypothetical protein